MSLHVMNLNSQSTLDVHRGKFTSRNKHVPVAVRINNDFSTDVINLQTPFNLARGKTTSRMEKKKDTRRATLSESECIPFFLVQIPL